MPGYVNYYYKDGKLPDHTKATFKEYEILTVHGVIIKNALTHDAQVSLYAGPSAIVDKRLIHFRYTKVWHVL